MVFVFVVVVDLFCFCVCFGGSHSHITTHGYPKADFSVIANPTRAQGALELMGAGKLGWDPEELVKPHMEGSFLGTHSEKETGPQLSLSPQPFFSQFPQCLSGLSLIIRTIRDLRRGS